MKFSSATSKLNLPEKIKTQLVKEASIGDVILVEVLTKNASYPYLEQIDGTLTALMPGDQIVGVVGARQALRGFVGYAPKKFDHENPLSLLNMGGVIGCYLDAAVGLGEPPQVKYLGTVVDDKGIVNMNQSALPETKSIVGNRKIILILGTCMNVGKTSIATQMISVATKENFKIGAAKIAGVAAIKDLQNFKKAGAIDVKSFLDCGLPSTVDAENLAQIMKNIINALQGELLIIELGDGIMGHYKVESVLKDAAIMSQVKSIVVCAADLASVYGAKQYLKEFNLNIDMISGPATDNIAGTNYIEKNLGIPAINGLKFPDQLFSAVRPSL